MPHAASAGMRPDKLNVTIYRLRHVLVINAVPHVWRRSAVPDVICEKRVLKRETLTAFAETV